MGIVLKDDRSRYYTQENNAVETFLKYAKAQEGLSHWTETCGCTTSVRIMDGMDLLENYKAMLIQLEDYLWCASNDITGLWYELKKAARPNVVPGSIPGNRIPQYYPMLVKRLFGVDAEYTNYLSYDDLVNEVNAGHGVQICLKNPGHYVAIVDVAPTGELIYDDPMPSRWPDGNGWHLRMPRTEYEINTKGFAVIYRGKL